MKPLLSGCAASRLVQRAGAIELVIWRLCSDVAQTVWLRPPNLRRSGDRQKSTRSRRSPELTLGTCRCRRIRRRERISLVKNRMQEICTSGCVSSEGWHVQQEKGLPGQELEAP